MKELVEMLLEITGFRSFSGVVHFLLNDLFALPSSLNHCSCESATFTQMGPGQVARGREGK